MADLFRLAVDLFSASPLFWLGAWGVLAAIGTVARTGRRAGVTLVGAGIVLAITVWLFKNRRDVGQTFVVFVITVIAAGWLFAVWRYPDLRWKLILPVSAVALVALFTPGGVIWPGQPGGLLWERAGNRPLKDVLRDWVEGQQVRRSVVEAAGQGATVGKAHRGDDGSWSVDTHLNADPTATLDPYAIGGRFNRSPGDARQVTVTEHAELGKATVNVSAEPPPPERTPWERLTDMGPRRWPGPYTSHPDAPIRVGFDAYGRGLTIPVPGTSQADNALLAGTTGAGKSGTLGVIISDLAFRDHTALILLDPDEVEMDLWTPRATYVALGKAECVRMLDQLERIIDARKAKLRASGQRYWRVGKDGPRIIVVVDEYAAIPDKAKSGMEQWLSRARKIGGGSIISTQRPERDVVPLIQRDNMTTRIGLGMMSAQASQMTMNLSTADGVDCTEIPSGLKGGFNLLVERSLTPGRGYLLSPPGVLGPDDDPIELAAREIAKATAGLRVPESELT